MYVMVEGRRTVALGEHCASTGAHTNRPTSTMRYYLLGLILCTVLSFQVLDAVAERSTLPSGEPNNEELEKAIPSAPVILDGSTLFSVRGLPSFPAEDRAQRIAYRIQTLAEDRAFGPQELKSVEVPGGTEITGREHVIMLVADPDGHLEGVNRQTLAHVYAGKIAEAIEVYRQERRPELLMRHTAYAIAAVLALFIGLWVGRITVRHLATVIERRYRRKIHDVSIQSFRIVTANRIWRLLNGLVSIVGAIGALIAIYGCLHYVLVLFPWTRGFARSLFGFLTSPVYTIASALLKAVPDAMFLVVLIVVTFYLLKLIRLFFTAVERETVTLTGFDPAWATPTHRLVRGLVVAFALVAAYPYIPGSNSQAFKGMTLLIGLIFSLGSTSLIGNMISGYSLAYRRAFKQGDRVKIGGYVGDVQDSKLMVTYLRSVKNEIIAVPNSKIVDEEIVNYSALADTEGLILHTTVGIGYGVPWRQVEAMLLEAAERTPGLLPTPTPFVRQLELGTFAVIYEINVYSSEPAAMAERYTALHRNILDIFNEYSVQIMTPAYEGDPERAKIVAKNNWYSAPASADQNGERLGTKAVGE